MGFFGFLFVLFLFVCFLLLTASIIGSNLIIFDNLLTTMGTPVKWCSMLATNGMFELLHFKNLPICGQQKLCHHHSSSPAANSIFFFNRDGFIGHSKTALSEWGFSYFAYFLLAGPEEVEYWNFSSSIVYSLKAVEVCFCFPGGQAVMTGVACTFTSISLTVEWELLIRGEIRRRIYSCTGGGKAVRMSW